MVGYNAYAQSIAAFDYDEAAKAVRWIAEHDTFMPALGRLRAEIGDDYDAPMLTEADRPMLPGYQARMDAEQRALSGEVEPAPPSQPARPGRIEDAHIDYDLEAFKRRKAEAKDAADRERERLANEGETQP